jgi:hypothetical protein
MEPSDSLAAPEPSTPSAARIYDYTLGGTRNFEVDRQAAEYMFSLLPSTRKWVRMLRESLQQFAARLAGEGFTRFVDFGSGLPTADHVHGAAPGAKVVYSDRDPATVAEARALLGGNPDVLYLESDIGRARALLESDQVRDFLGGERQVALGASGVAVFMSEDEIRRFSRDLHDWAAPGSKLFMTFETKDPALTSPRWEQFEAMFHRMGEPFRLHSLDAYLEMCRPWTVDAAGAVPLASFLGHGAGHITPEDREGIGLEFYAVVFEKK